MSTVKGPLINLILTVAHIRLRGLGFTGLGFEG